MSAIAIIQELIKPLLPGLMGMQLMEVSPERVVASMEVRPDLCTVGEILHGGALMAFADTLGGIATFVNLESGARTTTIESKTNFSAPCPLAPVSSASALPCTAARPRWYGRRT